MSETRWQKIETAPKDAYVTVLGCRYISATDCEIRTTHWDDNAETWIKDSPYNMRDDYGWAPTHWMPLPDPPDPPA